MSPKNRPDQELDPIFRPKTMAVIGASTETHALGRQILENVVRYGSRLEEIGINPFFASERAENCKAADARVRLQVDH